MSQPEVISYTGSSITKPRGPTRYFIPLCMGFAPVLLLLLSWHPEGDLSPQSLTLRTWSLPTLTVEIFTIIVALRERLLVPTLPRPTLATAAVGLLLVIALTDAALVAPNAPMAWMRTLVLIIHCLFGFSIMQLCGRAFEGRDLMHAWLAGFMVFALLLAFFVGQVPAKARFDWTFDLPAVSHIRQLGYYTAPVIALSFGLMALPRGRLYWACLTAVAMAAFIVSLWSGSRGAVAAAAAVLLIGFLLLPGLRTMRVVAGALTSALLGAAVAWLLPAPAAHMGVNRAVEATVGGQQGGITTGRTVIWEQTYQAILHRPLFGYGEAQMSAVAPFYGMVQPHNSVLQILLAWGLVGALCLLVVVLPFAIRLIRDARALGGEMLAPLMAVLALVIYSAYDGALYHVLPLSIVAACCGMAIRFAKSAQAPVHALGPGPAAAVAS